MPLKKAPRALQPYSCAKYLQANKPYSAMYVLTLSKTLFQPLTVISLVASK